MKSAAEPVGFAVFLGFVMLLAVFRKPVMPGDFMVGIFSLGFALRLLASAMFPVQIVDERRVRGVAMLALGVFLRPWLLPFFALRHHCSLGIAVRNRGLVVWIRDAANAGPYLISRL
jgi:hypothetical protein